MLAARELGAALGAEGSAVATPGGSTHRDSPLLTIPPRIEQDNMDCDVAYQYPLGHSNGSDSPSLFSLAGIASKLQRI